VLVGCGVVGTFVLVLGLTVGFVVYGSVKFREQAENKEVASSPRTERDEPLRLHDDRGPNREVPRPIPPPAPETPTTEERKNKERADEAAKEEQAARERAAQEAEAARKVAQEQAEADARAEKAKAKAPFVGRWRITPKDEGTFYMTLESSFEARKTNGGAKHGRWEVVGKQARVTWDDGWQNIFRPDRNMTDAFKPGASWDGPPTIVAPAVKVEGGTEVAAGADEKATPLDRMVDLLIKLSAAEEEAGLAKRQAAQARREAEDAAEKAQQAERYPRRTSGDNAAAAGSAEAATRVQDYLDRLEDSRQAVVTKQKARELADKAKEAEEKSRQAAGLLAEVRDAVRRAEQATPDLVDQARRKVTEQIDKRRQEEAARANEATMKKAEEARARQEQEKVSRAKADQEAKARRILKQGHQLADRDFPSEARERYQEVIDKYPDTEAAATAKKLMDNLGK
jgi:hypothetical protein